jgi:acylpyruvate hydrolase
MKIVVFGPERRVGAVVDDVVVDLAPDLGAFIEAGPRAIDAARKRVESRRGIVYDARSVHLHAPHVRGARVACVSGNFADHTAAIDAKRANDPNFQPDIPKITREIRERGIVGFWKVGRDAAGPDEDVFHPARTRCFDFESELAIVVGKPARNVHEGDWSSYVWGVTLFQDWSARQGIKGAPQFTLLKNFDTSFSVGPWIVVDENIDPGSVQIETYVNGEPRQNYNTGAMIFTFAEALAFLTRDFTLYPGDLIAGGTAAGTCGETALTLPEGGFSAEGFLKPGDVVEIRAPAVGVLRNRVVAARP